jgi:tetratricopeptide (TPR) repeat protein
MQRLPLATLALLLAAAPGHTQDKTWIGKTVYPKRFGMRLKGAPDAGKPVDLGALNQMSYKVLDEIDGRLKVSQAGKVGWFDKKDAVPAEQAVEYFSGLLRKNPANEGMRAKLATVRGERGELDLALMEWTELVRQQPKKATYWNNRGVIYSRMKKHALAVADYSEAIRLDHSPNYLMNRAQAYQLLKQMDKMMADCDEIIRLRPDWEAPYHRRGLGRLALKEYAKAKEDFTVAVAKCTDRLIEADMRDKFARLLATHPDAEFRDGKLAVELARKACELCRWDRMNIVETLAAAYAETGDFEQAVRYQKKVLADPDYARRAGALPQKRLDLYLKKMPYRTK